MKEEQNFISANEIDNMTLIMPTATRRAGAGLGEGAPVTGGKVKKKKKHRDKKRDKNKEVQASLMVACLKRLLPVGLNLFAGREQELVQHCKDRYLKVSSTIQHELCPIGNFDGENGPHKSIDSMETKSSFPTLSDRSFLYVFAPPNPSY